MEGMEGEECICSMVWYKGGSEGGEVREMDNLEKTYRQKDMVLRERVGDGRFYGANLGDGGII